VHMKVLCHGNTSAEQAARLIEEAATALGSRPLARSQMPVPRLLQLPADVEVVLRLHPSLYPAEAQPLLNLDDKNSAIELQIQCGVDRRPGTMSLELLCHILAQPAYEQLRTSEQLGYIVSLGFKYDLGVVGLRVIVQSATHDAAYLDGRIEAFFAGVPQLLSALTDEEFENHRKSVVDTKLETPKTLRQESAIYWNEICQATYDFGRDAEDAAVLAKLTKEDLITYWNDHLDSNAPGRRKLSSQTFAAHHTLPDKLEKGIGGREMHYIDGFEGAIEYKRTLSAYPAPPRHHNKDAPA
jgi:insulysin